MAVAEQYRHEATLPFQVEWREGDNIQFSGTSRLLYEAAGAFGVELEEQEQRDWRILLGAGYIIDQCLDGEKAGTIPHIATMLFSGEPIDGIPREFQERCRQFVHRQTPSRQVEIMDQLGQIKGLVEAQATSESPHEVIEIRRREADIFASLLSLPAQDRSDASRRERFNSWLTSFSRTGYMVDSFMDIKRDFLSGESGVRPTLHSHRVLAAAALKETFGAIRKTPLSLIGKCAMVAMRYEARNKKPEFSGPSQPL
jgi:hypothetical protein